MMRRILTYIAGLGAVVLFAGCAVPTKQIDYSAYKASRPRSIVVLPPLNESPDINATYAMLAQSTAPLADLYAKRDLLVQVDGMGEIDVVTGRIMEALASRGITGS